jgi:dihydrofolate reductase
VVAGRAKRTGATGPGYHAGSEVPASERFGQRDVDNPTSPYGFRHEGSRNVQKLIVFNNVSLDGYFASEGGDISWLKSDSRDAEFDAFVADNAKVGGQLVFGRVTYELMASYWPTPVASENDPVVAERMNSLPKVVFSRTLAKAWWTNTELIRGDVVAEIRKMKNCSGEGMAILGSGTIVSQLAPEGLIDEYQVVVHPIVLGKGRTMFDGVKKKLALKLTNTRAFANGKVLLCYRPEV